MRTFLTVVLPLIAPTIVFFIWAWFAKKRAEKEERHEPIPAWQNWPWARLVLTGAVLTALTLSAVAMMREAAPGQRYVPPRIENGELIPGHFVPAEQDESGESKTGRESETFDGLGTAPPSLPNQRED
ncbi:MAG: DUF6111 family protein [Marivibrio sp.]|uniref:DUF6111 family protein n=1 Tax=Marivibrio sp. TaxID=2039719 RepID=UPI0032EC2505